ncbi:hypothetical protein [Nodularia chucula]|uniref:hypothetical protein n=1 Tax=Nodularia chucula TaxID=3093667 RepID=UPI0039C76003
MNHWLGIALGAYLIGATIEGVNTVSQLSHSVKELAKDHEESSPSDNPPHLNWQILTTIASVSMCGSLCWPCRLIHRSIKGWVSSRNL